MQRRTLIRTAAAGPLLVAAGNPLGIQSLEDLARRAIRVVMTSESEPGAWHQYFSALEALIGQEATKSILTHETATLAAVASSTATCFRRLPSATLMSASSSITWRAILRRPTPSSVPW